MTERRSFELAGQMVTLTFLSLKRTNPNLVIILVANKSDLVRSRQVTLEEGKSLALKFEVKYIETSVHIEHNVDELLVGIAKQVQLKKSEQQQTGGAGKKSGSNSASGSKTGSMDLHSSDLSLKTDCNTSHGRKPSKKGRGPKSVLRKFGSFNGLQLARNLVKRVLKRNGESTEGPQNGTHSCDNLHVL